VSAFQLPGDTIVLVALLDPVVSGASRSMQIGLQQTAKRENMELVFEAAD
jgi:hypothetical protein